MQMNRLQKSIAQTLFDLSIELGLCFDFNSQTEGIYITRIYEDGSIKMTSTLYLDDEDLITKLDKIVAELYEL